MRDLNSLDQKILSHKVEDVFKVVSNFETCKEWFPEDAKVEIIKINPSGVGSIIQVKTGIISFNIEMMKITPNKEILVRYSGAYEGEGIWYFFETTNGTKLMYEIELKIKHPLVVLLNFFVSVSSLHSKVMMKMFDRLEKYLNKIYNVNSDSLNNNSNTQPKIFTLSSN
jgi:ribosome-associated toxin RatA of RatAB toxin-antitoxin module